jgi:polyisoprenyl-teichoic acid--peptidoglycan teichoic acid transferase
MARGLHRFAGNLVRIPSSVFGRIFLCSSLAAGVLAGHWLLSPVHGSALAQAARQANPAPELLPAPRLLSPVTARSAAIRPEPSAAPAPKPPPKPREGFENTLLVGIDRRPDGKGAGLADTILVARFEKASGHAGIISIPRDLWVTIPGYGDNRINTVPVVAARSKRSPIELFSRVIEDTLGLPVAHGIFIDLGLFERSVDLVGGVEVDVACPIQDVFHDTRVDGGRRKLELAAGRALLDGPTAAMYVRSRHGRSDFGRSRRQQAVLLGLRERVLAREGIGRLPELLSELESSIYTDLRRYELLELGRRVLSLERRKLHGLVLAPPLSVAHATDDGKAVLLPDRPAIEQAIVALASAPPPGEALNVACPPADAALRRR